MSDAQALLVRPKADELGRRFMLISHCMAGVGAVASLAMIALDQPLPALALATVLWGWSEVDGHCGTALFCTLSPLRAVDSSGKVWRRAATAYLLGGIVSAGLVGLLVGAIGLLVPGDRTASLLLVAAAAAVLMAREFKLLWFRLPQLWRQTDLHWAFHFGVVPAAAMWGVHLGIGFATTIKHGGFYVLIAFAFLLGPWLGALLMSIYWFGRALPILMAPLLTSQCSDGERLAAMLAETGTACRHVAAAGLFSAVVDAVYLTRTLAQ